MRIVVSRDLYIANASTFVKGSDPLYASIRKK